ncbi:MAG: hypothetical protein A2556_01750 [Candidatus Vogelbacteria bacterium RIFOXYD2_FULL_44_9]|uniref:Uncharacterized protein n=1 Tax=Candidatus Vogelbacteria bacterium RIFOXYD2_FULL_44_9 TaxID=1802441 RepID=A0A1G2QPM7_9BACT|nr:MAG: hypothetical protein A2556_01750 [Candidatus Vogelbacteria bacterium RIFOXYD2_FULL_44_9]
MPLVVQEEATRWSERETTGVISRKTKKEKRRDRIKRMKSQCRHPEGYNIGHGEVQCVCGTILKVRQIPTQFAILPPVNSAEWFEEQKRSRRRTAV